MILFEMNRKYKQLSKSLLLLSVIEGFVCVYILLLIPTDPKNDFLWGYSLSRISQIAFVMIGSLFFFFCVILKPVYNFFVSFMMTVLRKEKIVNLFGFFTFIMLWFVIWYPRDRFGGYEASYLRMSPIIFWISLVGFQLFLFIQHYYKRLSFQMLQQMIRKNRKTLFLIFSICIIISLFFTFLVFQPIRSGLAQLYFSPGTTLSSFQLFIALSGGVFLFFITQNSKENSHRNKKWDLITFFLIWGLTFVIWNNTSFLCTNDRLGPFPPNYKCYPTINDAVYSIGSHYISLGNGVNNHWPTDKPAYMLFLAIGQWILGPSIDRYLLFQIFTLSCFPAILFLCGKKIIGFFGGLVLSTLSIIMEVNQIQYYSQIGEVHVHIENPEVLSALVLLLFSIILFRWITQPNSYRYAILAGGVLGIATLIRVNSIFIVPMTLVFFATMLRYYRIKKVYTTLLFVLTFCLVFMPWFVTLQDSSGNYHYLNKLRGAVTSRSTISESVSQSDDVNNSNDLEKKPDEKESFSGVSILSSFGFHLINNYYMGFATLPTEFSFLALPHQFKDPLWNVDLQVPLWEKQLAAQVYLMLAMNYFFVLVGIILAWKKFRFAGLTGLIVQFGYYLGNAVAITSGGRYQIPVNWVNLFYFAIGLYVSIYLLLSMAMKIPRMKFSIDVSGKIPDFNQLPRSKNLQVLGTLGLFIVVGAILPGINLLPTHLPKEKTAGTSQHAYQILCDEGLVTQEQWIDFTSSAESIVIEGYSYHPMYHRRSDINKGSLTFEMMVLANETVYPSYLFNTEPQGTFADGSHVILIGCNIGDDKMWSANRVHVRAIAVINLDQEAILSVNHPYWNCHRR